MTSNLNSREISMTAIMAAIYVITNLIPISQFIGAAVFIPLSIIFVPVMAYYLQPREALMSAAIGGLGSIFINPGGAAVFGVFAILTPAISVTLGSLGYVNRKYTLIPIGFLVLEFVFYVIWYGGKAPYLWGTHYLIAVILAGIYFFTNKNNLLLIPAIAMCENAMLNIYSLTIAGLPADLWGFILVPSMIERTIATIGAVLIIQGLNRSLPSLRNRT
jgi:hypothetical protein